MRFSCGPTRDDRNKQKEFWNKWFAWYPVRIASNQRAWLEYVERKGTYHSDYSMGNNNHWWTWRYRLPLHPS